MCLFESLYEFVLVFGTGMMFMVYFSLPKKKKQERSFALLENTVFLYISVLIGSTAGTIIAASENRIIFKNHWVPLCLLSLVLFAKIMNSTHRLSQEYEKKIMLLHLTIRGLTVEEMEAFIQKHNFSIFPILLLEKFQADRHECKDLSASEVLKKLDYDLDYVTRMNRVKESLSNWGENVKHVNKK